MPKIVVAIPCYNCEKQIGRVLADFDDKLLVGVSEVLVIDNHSKDATLKAAQEAAARLGSAKVRILQNTENYGLGGTHKVAFSYGLDNGADYVAILHGDHQAKTQELGALIDVAERHPELAAVLGSRFMAGSRLDGYSPLRIFGNVGLNYLYSLLTWRRVRDLGSGLNLFRMRDLSDRTFLGFSDGLTFNIDLLLSYLSRRQPILFVPITWSETDQISNAKAFRVGWIALKAIVKWRIGAGRPLSVPLRPAYSFARIA